jgi:parvulin-like peptidyl-prolyl isomerase
VRRYLLFLLIASIVSIAIGCAEKPAAIVDGAEISESTLQWALNQRIRDHEASGAVVSERTLRNLVLDQMISDKLLYLGAVDKGITLDDEEALKTEVHRITQRMGQDAFTRSLKEASLSKDDFTELVRERLMVGKFAESLVSDEDITEDDVKEYYKDSPTPFLAPERVNVRFIQTQMKEEADALIEQLKKGQPFDKLADSLQGKSGITVSSYSWAKPTFFSPDIADALKEIEVGSHGGPLESGSGYFIFRVKEREHERAKTLEEARDEIKSMLIDQRRQSVLAHWLDERRKKADIIIN